MLPEITLEHHLVYKPKRPRQPGQNAELYYLQLISIVPEKQKQEEGEGKKEYDVKSQKWRIRLEDLPEVTRKPVTSRNVLGAGFGEGDALGLVDSLGFMFVPTGHQPPLVFGLLKFEKVTNDLLHDGVHTDTQ